MFSKSKRGGYKQRPSLCDFVNSKIIRKFVVSNCSSEVCMAKVGLENDTLKQLKCPSNWEYSTGQRQLLDIQSGEQMDRVSFSAQNQVSEESETFLFLCKIAPLSTCGKVVLYKQSEAGSREASEKATCLRLDLRLVQGL